MRRIRRSTLLAVILGLMLPAIALASWQAASSNGKAYSKAKALPVGNTPTASVSNRSVTVSWTAPSGGAPVTGYVVKRYNNSGTLQTIGANCSGTVAGTSCTESSVSAGTWKYSVTPANQNWRGTESAQSTAVAVGSPALTVSPTDITGLPTTLSGSISNFIAGQTVTFRLDDPSTGTLLAGSITPTPVPASGAATVSVTVPIGTSNGSHTIYAVGSGGDTASAAISVAVPTTITTSAWDFRDADTGTEANVSDPLGFSGDGRTYQANNFATGFSATRFLDFDYNNPVGPGQTPSAVSFSFRFADLTGLSNDCFYFETRRQSTNAVIATHGSTGAPVGCTNSTTQQTFTTSLPEIDTVDEANDLRVRVYVQRGLLGSATVLDQATVSGTAAGSTPFTLYEKSFNDQANGTANTTPWELYAADSTVYANGSNWPSSPGAAVYLKETFPAYVPSAATISNVAFNHAFHTNTNGRAVCYTLDVYAGATLLATHGTAASPVSCSSSSTTDQTDSVSLPEVTTAAQANGLSVRLHYFRTGAAASSSEDRAAMTITYVR